MVGTVVHEKCDDGTAGHDPTGEAELAAGAYSHLLGDGSSVVADGNGCACDRRRPLVTVERSGDYRRSERPVLIVLLIGTLLRTVECFGPVHNRTAGTVVLYTQALDVLEGVGIAEEHQLRESPGLAGLELHGGTGGTLDNEGSAHCLPHPGCKCKRVPHGCDFAQVIEDRVPCHALARTVEDNCAGAFDE